MVSNQFDRAGSNPGRKVRVVAKIRGFSGSEANSEPSASRAVEWISVNRENSEDVVTISFGNQSSSRYLVDYFYKEHEDNEMIFSREVKPLVSAAFEGHNSTVIAHGARGSGKTCVIQGSAERPGLAMLAIAEFLSMAEKNRKSISVSFYEVDHQEHAVDLLNPEQPPILVFEDRGRIQFKGLTQIPVKSTTDFQNLYLAASSAQKGAPKKGGCERFRRSHMGLIVHVFTQNENVECLLSKMNFVDLAGYEDARKKSGDGSYLAEINKINKSIYALLNVCHALTTNECRVPYRESKLTRMLQDSLRGTSKILLVSCLNPSFCQDSIYMVSLASRSCQVHRISFDSTKKIGSSARQMLNSHKNQIPKSVSGTAKKLHGSKLLEKKSGVAMKSARKGRKLFDEASHSAAKAEKDNSLSEAGNHVELNSEGEKENSFPASSHDVKLNLTVDNDDSSLNASTAVELNFSLVEKGISVDREDHQEQHTPFASNYSESEALSIAVQEDHNMNKENNSSRANEDGSPPISSQLRDLSNSLKLLYSSTPLCVQIPETESISLDNQMSADIVEPKTPVIEQNMSVNNKWDVMNAQSPWGTFSMRGSEMKNSLVQEYLRVLNTADKEELKKLKGIGEKRATFILELREESPEPFKSLDDLKDIGLSAKQIKGMMKKEVGELFS
ncbi:kinesin-like protein KIN-10C [Abrus precatorius]|uniref:Kinesin-like protein KIN-10C n=1 Tax=Abrus precatorius TaxID=3816 RepID=A0A8B8LLX1_ABRPR|nr:kinesin-like protein KIN-10C [Abrus precatorius]